MSRPLPYSHFKWSFAQHDVGLAAESLYKFLRIAAAFEGDSSANGEKITALMMAENILTPNERDGTPDAWRDYQQILAELGLIYSTRLVNTLRLTPVGRLYLSGGIGYSELIGLQALRYQYPNGQKSQISPNAKASLGPHLRETLTESQAALGILVKPAVLVLRVLLELSRRGADSSLSLDECLACLLPCRSNEEWELAVEDVLRSRAPSPRAAGLHPHARRNAQDWFRFLLRTDFFEAAGEGSIRLSGYAIANSERLIEVCEKLGAPQSFWIPTDFSTTGRARWFDWFGSVDSTVIDLTRGNDVGEEYIEANYVEGLDDQVDDESDPLDGVSRVLVLSPVNIERLRDPLSVPKFENNSAITASRLRDGVLKRHAKTVLHNQLVAELAEALQMTGADVREDPNSVDILASWAGAGEAIFEVKTATRRTLQSRIRLAVGQVEEYAYRNRIDRGIVADKAIAVNASVAETSWYRDFLVQSMDIALICMTAGGRVAYVPEGSRTRQQWHDKL
jgi:hypothetical protein